MCKKEGRHSWRPLYLWGLYMRPGSKAHPKAGARKIKNLELTRTALEYRKSGMSYQEIANKIDKSLYWTYTHIKEAIKEITQEPAEELLRIYNIRLDALLNAVWKSATEGDLAAVQTALSVLRDFAKINGLNPPDKHAPTTPDGREPYPGFVPPPTSAVLSVTSKLDRLRSFQDAELSGKPN